MTKMPKTQKRNKKKAYEVINFSISFPIKEQIKNYKILQKIIETTIGLKGGISFSGDIKIYTPPKRGKK